MGLITALKTIDKDFVRDMIAKLLENVMWGENTKTGKYPRRRLVSRLPKQIQDKHRSLEVQIRRIRSREACYSQILKQRTIDNRLRIYRLLDRIMT